LPITRLLEVEDYLDYISNKILPGSTKAANDFLQLTSCAPCGLPEGLDVRAIADRMFMIMLQDFMDPWTFNQKNVMKCCKEFLLPGGKQIPFCAYNSVGYREQARAQLAERQRTRLRAERDRAPYEPRPLSFHFGGRIGSMHDR
jgi:hypothetical protein